MLIDWNIECCIMLMIMDAGSAMIHQSLARHVRKPYTISLIRPTFSSCA